MRFYARHPQPDFHCLVDEQDWQACSEALEDFTKADRELLLNIYREGDVLINSVHRASAERKVALNIIWKLITELERKVAVRRGLCCDSLREHSNRT
jgi:hypothetical protein